MSEPGIPIGSKHKHDSLKLRNKKDFERKLASFCKIIFCVSLIVLLFYFLHQSGSSKRAPVVLVEDFADFNPESCQAKLGIKCTCEFPTKFSPTKDVIVRVEQQNRKTTLLFNYKHETLSHCQVFGKAAPLSIKNGKNCLRPCLKLDSESKTFQIFRDIVEYSERVFIKRPIRAFFIGVGGGYVPTILTQNGVVKFEKIAAIELEPVVLNVAKKYFGLSKKIEAHVGDGFGYVMNGHVKGPIDLFVVDIDSIHSFIYKKITKEFLTKVLDVLSEDADASILINMISTNARSFITKINSYGLPLEVQHLHPTSQNLLIKRKATGK